MTGSTKLLQSFIIKSELGLAIYLSKCCIVENGTWKRQNKWAYWKFEVFKEFYLKEKSKQLTNQLLCNVNLMTVKTKIHCLIYYWH